MSMCKTCREAEALIRRLGGRLEECVGDAPVEAVRLLIDAIRQAVREPTGTIVRLAVETGHVGGCQLFVTAVADRLHRSVTVKVYREKRCSSGYVSLRPLLSAYVPLPAVGARPPAMASKG